MSEYTGNYCFCNEILHTIFYTIRFTRNSLDKEKRLKIYRRYTLTNCWHNIQLINVGYEPIVICY